MTSADPGKMRSGEGAFNPGDSPPRRTLQIPRKYPLAAIHHANRAMTSGASSSKVSVSFLKALLMKSRTPASWYRSAMSVAWATVPEKPRNDSAASGRWRFAAVMVRGTWPCQICYRINRNSMTRPDDPNVTKPTFLARPHMARFSLRTVARNSIR